MSDAELVAEMESELQAFHEWLDERAEESIIHQDQSYDQRKA
jgi:hypothetical protein